MVIFLGSTLSSIKVPPLKSIPKFNPLKKISKKLNRTKTKESMFAVLNFDSKL